MVGEQPVVALRHRDRGPVHRAGVQGAPPPVGALHPVGDHDMGVQVRVVVAGVPVVERRGDHPPGLHLRHAVRADPGPGHVPLHDREDVGDGLPVRGVDRVAGRIVGQRPQHADRLRDREGAVEPGHRAAPVGTGGVDVRGAAQGGAGHRVGAVGEQSRHLRRRHLRPGRQAVAVGQAGEAAAQPGARRGAGHGVVAGHRRARGPAVVGGHGVQQVGVGVARVADAQAHHSEPPVPRRRARWARCRHRGEQNRAERRASSRSAFPHTSQRRAPLSRPPGPRPAPRRAEPRVPPRRPERHAALRAPGLDGAADRADLGHQRPRRSSPPRGRLFGRRPFRGRLPRLLTLIRHAPERRPTRTPVTAATSHARGVEMI